MRKLSWDSVKVSYDYKKITTNGVKFITPLFIAFSLQEQLNKTRLGVIASRKIGCAVKRNKAKRRLKAAFSEVAKELTNISVVLIARHQILTADYTDITLWINKHIKNIPANIDEKIMKIEWCRISDLNR